MEAVELDAAHPTLDHHRPGRLGLFGTAMGLDAIAAAGRRRGLCGGRFALCDVEIFQPCMVEDGGRHRLVVRFGGGDGAWVGEVVSPAGGGPEKVHFRARLGGGDSVDLEPAAAGRVVGALVSAGDIYRLFPHGPAFQVVASARRVEGGMRTEMAVHADLAHVPPVARLIEFAMQSAGLLELAASGRMMIPHALASVSVCGAADALRAPVTAVARFSESGCDVDVCDADALVLGLRGYRTLPLPFAIDGVATVRLAELLGRDGVG